MTRYRSLSSFTAEALTEPFETFSSRHATPSVRLRAKSGRYVRELRAPPELYKGPLIVAADQRSRVLLQEGATMVTFSRFSCRGPILNTAAFALALVVLVPAQARAQELAGLIKHLFDVATINAPSPNPANPA